ncbi:Heat-inducible transcription repressor hrcA [Moritella viscosa]|nr:Heat-inducible transcription repressor hrcA [Moritella viscosa]
MRPANPDVYQFIHIFYGVSFGLSIVNINTYKIMAIFVNTVSSGY